MTKITEVPPSNNMDETVSKDYIKNFSKRMLKTQLFVGTFQEKRYVEPLNSYRDVVKINSEEKEFIENVLAVRKKLRRTLVEGITWIGITGPDTIGAPVGYNLWVILPIEVFGTYWFKVKTVEFLGNEVRIKLDVVRPIKNEKSASDISEAEDSQNFDLKATVQDISSNVRTSLISIVKNYVTLTNIKDSLVFISLLIGTILAGGLNIIKYIMEYLLKFMKETSGIIKVCTPIIISCIDLVKKTIYGLFALIATMIHGRQTPSQPVYYYDNPNRLQYRAPRRALPYRSSVTIEPVDED